MFDQIIHFFTRIITFPTFLGIVKTLYKVSKLVDEMPGHMISILRFGKSQIANRTSGANVEFFGLRHVLFPFSLDQGFIFQEKVQFSVNKGDVKAKVFGLFSFVRTFRTRQLITQCADHIIEFISKMPEKLNVIKKVVFVFLIIRGKRYVN